MTNEAHPCPKIQALLDEIHALCQKHEATIDVELEGVSVPFRVLICEPDDGPEIAEYYLDYVTPQEVVYKVASVHRMRRGDRS